MTQVHQAAWPAGQQHTIWRMCESRDGEQNLGQAQIPIHECATLVRTLDFAGWWLQMKCLYGSPICYKDESGAALVGSGPTCLRAPCHFLSPEVLSPDSRDSPPAQFENHCPAIRGFWAEE